LCDNRAMRDQPSQTAEVVCLFRAMERHRAADERIVDDPYAEHFLGTATRAALTAFRMTGRLGLFAQEHAPGVSTFVVARHRFIDDALTRALASGVEQLVLLGAGYDSRAYRFAEEIGARPVFELDFPSTSAAKRRISVEHADRFPDIALKRVPIDFLSERIDERLVSAGFKIGARSLFVWEGVSMYLTRAAVKETLNMLRAVAAPGSELAVDFWFLLDSPDVVSTLHRTGPNLAQWMGEPITLSMHPEDVGSFLEREGFELVEVADAGELERRYCHDGRRVYPACYCVLARSRGKADASAVGSGPARRRHALSR